MTPRRAMVLTATIGMVFLCVALVLVFGPPADSLGALRWGLGLPFALIGLVNLALFPRFSRETLPPDADFRPLDAQGHPVVGSELIQQIAGVLARELADTPHQIETSPDSVRVSYDSGVFRESGSRAIRQFQWRTTLAPTSAPATFIRLDQGTDHRVDSSWAKASVSAGWRWSAGARGTVSTDGVTATHSASTGPVSSAVKLALQECGARQEVSTMNLVGIANAALGILIAIGVVVGAAL